VQDDLQFHAAILLRVSAFIMTLVANKRALYKEQEIAPRVGTCMRCVVVCVGITPNDTSYDAARLM
jgi:hypothetical protein